MTEQTEENIIRPQLLTVLCVLTFVGSGFSFLANGIMFLTIEDWKLAYEQGLFESIESQFELGALEMVLGVNPTFYLLQSILYLFSLTGAFLMWNLKKQGFHVYAIAQILLLIIYKLYLVAAPFPLLPMLITITFILLYYRNLQYMK